MPFKEAAMILVDNLAKRGIRMSLTTAYNKLGRDYKSNLRYYRQGGRRYLVKDEALQKFLNGVEDY